MFMPRCPEELNFTISNKISLNFNSSQNLNLLSNKSWFRFVSTPRMLYDQYVLDLLLYECSMVSLCYIYTMNAVWSVCALSSLRMLYD